MSDMECFFPTNPNRFADDVRYWPKSGKHSLLLSFFVFDPLRKWSALRASALNFRIVPCPLWMADDYLRSIEPLIAIVLGCMRWKSPARGPVTSFLFLRYRLQSFQSWG
jgi:hypothetical protein